MRIVAGGARLGPHRIVEGAGGVEEIIVTRHAEIARMLGGQEITDRTRAHARELLEGAA